MKVGEKKLRMGDGSLRKFKSAGARARFEKVAEAVKHGFKPKEKK